MRPKVIPSRPPKKRVLVEAGVLPQLQANADATLEQHCAMWEQAYGERVSRWTMSRAIKRLGWTRKKKSLRAAERNEEERATWRVNASKLPTESLVVIDETGSNIALTPLYAPCTKGRRLCCKKEADLLLLCQSSFATDFVEEVDFFFSSEGYNRLSLTRASAVVKRQLTVASSSLRRCCQAWTSRSSSSCVPMRRERHWRASAESSISAIFNQLPWTGV